MLKKCQLISNQPTTNEDLTNSIGNKNNTKNNEENKVLGVTFDNPLKFEPQNSL